MKKLITAQQAKNILLLLLGVLILFHLLVIIGLVPSSLVWGDQIPQENILPMELIAIVITVSFGLFILIKMRYLAEGRTSKFANIAIWAIVAFLLFNTVTNVLSDVAIENFFFAPLALIMAILTLRLALEK